MEDMRISPNYRTSNWKDLKLTLESSEEDWQKGIDILRDRIDGRFLNYMAQIDKGNFAGFAIMALACLLIETLQQFREGVGKTPRGKSKEYLVRFLTETSFGEHFDQKSAERFYTQIRCGILHQAEAEKSSRIRTDIEPLVCCSEDGKGLVINRRKFFTKLREVFNEYLDTLKDPSKINIRDNFIRKMNYICRIPFQELGQQ